MAGTSGARSPKHSSIESKPDRDPSTENHGVHACAGTSNDGPPASSTIASRSLESMPRMGRPSDARLPFDASLPAIASASAIPGARITWWTFRVFPSRLYMVEISAERTNAGARRAAAGTPSMAARSITGLRPNVPFPLSTSFSRISAIQPGCVKSPVPTTATPFLQAAAAMCSRSASREVALECLE